MQHQHQVYQKAANSDSLSCNIKPVSSVCSYIQNKLADSSSG